MNKRNGRELSKGVQIRTFYIDGEVEVAKRNFLEPMQPLNMKQLVYSWLEETFSSCCPICGIVFRDTKIKLIPGKYTIVSVNRTYGQDTNKTLTKLELGNVQNEDLDNLLCNPVFFLSHLLLG